VYTVNMLQVHYTFLTCTLQIHYEYITSIVISTLQVNLCHVTRHGVGGNIISQAISAMGCHDVISTPLH